jgi:hypothetical protein
MDFLKYNKLETYVNDGFQKICDVSLKYLESAQCPDVSDEWYYSNINEALMYLDHKSWVYFIVDGDTIVKVGETGNPLGIRNSRVNRYFEDQPISGTRSRFGRLARFGGDNDTDGRIRRDLKECVNKGSVSLWARKCEIKDYEVMIGGELLNTKITFHKELELQYIDRIHPILNQGRK